MPRYGIQHVTAKDSPYRLRAVTAHATDVLTQLGYGDRIGEVEYDYPRDGVVFDWHFDSDD